MKKQTYQRDLDYVVPDSTLHGLFLLQSDAAGRTPWDSRLFAKLRSGA